MSKNPCFDCVGSCCKLEIDVTRAEYKELVGKGYESAMITRANIFISENKEYENRRDFLDEMYDELFAIIKKGEDGFCTLLNKSNKLCSIYEDRPRVCRDYSNQSQRCKIIRQTI